LAHRSLVRRFADGLVVFLPQKRGCGIEVGHLLPTGLHRTGAGDAVALALVHHLRGDSLNADLRYKLNYKFHIFNDLNSDILY